MRKILLVLVVLFSGIVTAQTEPYTGTIDNNTPFQTFAFSVETDGSTIVLDIQPTSGNLDTLLYLVDGSGNIIAENDDRSRRDFSSRIEFPQADARPYTVVATRYGVVDGESSGDFELTVDVLPPAEVVNLDYDTSPEALIAAGFPEIAPRPRTEWTVLAYYGGDNNLEPGLLNDFNEFELAGGSSEKVRVVMLMDRHPEYTDASGNWNTVRLFEVGADVSGDDAIIFPPTVDTEPLADLGDLDTGSGEVLARFLVWAIQNYPAEKYAISFASHGAGWKGIVADYSTPDTILSLPELRSAFSQAVSTAGVDKFELLVNDACSMSSIEYFDVVSPFFRYSVASPEIIIDPAMDMTLFTDRLKESPETVDISALGKELVDTYMDRDIAMTGDADIVYFTNAVTDLDQFSPVVDAVESFARLVNQDIVINSQMLGEARSNTYTYTHFSGNTTMVDLGSLMTQVIALSRDGEIIEAAENVLTALDDARLYSKGGDRVDGRVAYYNIYFPESSAYFRMEYLDESPLGHWSSMLRNYYNAVTPQVWAVADGTIPFHQPIAPKVSITSVYPSEDMSLLNPPVFGTEIVARNLSYVDATIDLLQEDGSAIRMSQERILDDVLVADVVERQNVWSSGVSTKSVFWDPRLPVISDGSSSNFELLIQTEEVAFLDGFYLAPGSETWQEVSVVFDLEGQVQRVINRAEGTNALAVIDIPVGSSFVAFRSIVSPDGRVTLENGNFYTWPEGGLTWEWQPAPTGDYQLGFLATAYGGTTGYAGRQVQINNDGIDSSLLGDRRPDLGFVVVRPVEWDRIAFSNADFFVRTSSPEGDSNITVYLGVSGYTAEVVDDNVTGWVDDVLAFYGVERTGDFRDVLVDGQSATEFDFTYENEDGLFTGRAFAVFSPVLGIGQIFGAQALDANIMEGIYADMLAGHRFMDLEVLYESETVAWLFRPDDFDAAYRHPVPINWIADFTTVTGAIEDGIWLRYAESPASLTFAAIATTTTADLLATEVQPGTENFEQVASRTYTAPAQTWDVVIYTAERDGVPVSGRLYTAGDYAVWMETADGASIFTDILEPVVDGFEIFAP